MRHTTFRAALSVAVLVLFCSQAFSFGGTKRCSVKRQSRATKLWRKVVNGKYNLKYERGLEELIRSPERNLNKLQQRMKTRRAEAWNPTIRKQLRRIDKMDNVYEKNGIVFGENRDGGKRIVQFSPWVPAAIANTRLPNGLTSNRGSFGSRPASVTTSFKVGKRLPKILRGQEIQKAIKENGIVIQKGDQVSIDRSPFHRTRVTVHAGQVDPSSGYKPVKLDFELPTQLTK